MSGGDFGAFPCKQRPSILSVGSERGCLNRISIKKKERVRRGPALRRQRGKWWEGHDFCSQLSADIIKANLPTDH